MEALRASIVRWHRLAFSLGLALLIPACDYFRPTQPQAPTSASSFIPDYSSPDSTLATIAKAIADKARTIGATAYDGAFADSTSGSLAGYHQFFWPQDVADWTPLSGHLPPSDWNFGYEHNFYSPFIRVRPDAYHMDWAKDDPNPDNIGADVATIHRHYLVTSHAPDGRQTSFLAIGYADLVVFRFPDGNWRIVKWDDRRDPSADPGDQEQVTLGRRRLNTQ